MISGAEKIEVDCARRSPPSAPLDAGSIPAISTSSRATCVRGKRGPARPRRFCAASPRGAGASPPAPPVRWWGLLVAESAGRLALVVFARLRLAWRGLRHPHPCSRWWGAGVVVESAGRPVPGVPVRLRHPHPRSRWWGLGWSWRVRTVSCPWFPFWVRHLHPSLRWCGLGWSSEARAVPSPAFPSASAPAPRADVGDARRRGEAEAPDAEIRHPRHPPQSPLGRRWKGGEAPSMVPPFVL